MTKSETIIINNIRDCAKECSKEAAELKGECKALYEEVKDFIDYESLDLDDYLYGVELTLKDGAELTFTTDTETAYYDKDTKVRIMVTSLLGIPHYSYRDDFVDDCVDYIKDGINVLCERYDHDAYEFYDELNDAGELLYYSLLKTALTVAKEHKSIWDDEDEDESVAE